MRIFPDWLTAYLELTENSEAPTLFHFWTGVATIAGALRRHVWVEEYIFQITPNFYIVFVAPPGVATKSTTIGLGMRLLAKVPNIHFGPQSMTWQGLSVALEESLETILIDDNPVKPVVIQSSALTIPVSEFGTFLHVKDEGLIDFLTDMWDGKQGVWSHRTKTGDKPVTSIINPWLNIIGCTTPSWLRGNFPRYLIDGGFISRCIFLYASKKAKFIARPSRLINPTWFNERADQLVEDLTTIAKITGAYQLSPEADAWYNHWYEEHSKSAFFTVGGDRYGGYTSRKHVHLTKLAMVFSASRRDEPIIHLEEMQRAERMLNTHEQHLRQAFDVIGVTDQKKNELEILSIMAAKPEISAFELWKHASRQIERKQFEEALRNLMLEGLVRRIAINGVDGYALTEDGHAELGALK